MSIRKTFRNPLHSRSRHARAVIVSGPRRAPLAKAFVLSVACALLLCLGVAAEGCGEKKESPTLTVMVHDSFKISDALVKDFEKSHGCTLVILRAGDAGAVLNQALLTKNNPLADVLFGVDNTFMSRALDGGIFEPYASPLLSDIPDELELDRSHRLLPVDFGDVCLNYDKAWFTKHGVNPPTTLEDLLKPAYKDLLVVENPATSSPGLAFLLTTIGCFGEKGFREYWRGLRNNGVLVTSGWEDAYWGQFSAASKGSRPIVVSYATSPAAEVYFSESKPAEPPTAAVLTPNTAFRQIEFVGVLKGAKNKALAQAFVDMMLDRSFQEQIPLSMFMFPANKNARLPDVFLKHARSADKPVALDAGDISAKREAWIEAWTEVVLR